MDASRPKAAWSAWLLERGEARARRVETEALERAGSGFLAALPPSSLPTDLAVAVAAVRGLEARRDQLARRLVASFENDRRDYRGTSSEWGRWLVILRGVLDRLVLREEARRARKELPRQQARVGALALGAPECAALVSAEASAAVERARAEQRRLADERRALLAPWDGAPLPRWAAALLDEIATFSVFVRKELRKKVVLGAPALAAMLSTWWIASHFTRSSTVEAAWHNLSGQGRKGLSDASLARLQFWLPLLATALVAYLTTSVARRIQRRYEAAALPPSVEEHGAHR